MRSSFCCDHVGWGRERGIYCAENGGWINGFTVRLFSGDVDSSLFAYPWCFWVEDAMPGELGSLALESNTQRHLVLWRLRGCKIHRILLRPMMLMISGWLP